MIEETIDPCRPTPCGRYSECAVRYGNTAGCTCKIGYVGVPPNCRPECLVNPDCPSNRACKQEKCRDPCKGACASSANCQVISHRATCSCPAGTRGDPYSAGCTPIPPSKFLFFLQKFWNGFLIFMPWDIISNFQTFCSETTNLIFQPLVWNSLVWLIKTNLYFICHF